MVWVEGGGGSFDGVGLFGVTFNQLFKGCKHRLSMHFDVYVFIVM